MRLALDTTYLLPTIGVSVKDISAEEVLRPLRTKSNETAVSEISLFELSAKAAKLVAIGKLDPKRVPRGMRALVEDESIVKLHAYDNGQQLTTAMKLREKVLGDFIDCIILASAIHQADALLTEDGAIHELKRREEFRELVKAAKNPDFEIRRL